jgi:hypothetical protein
MTTSTILTMGPAAFVALVVIVVLATTGVSVLRRLRRSHVVTERRPRRLATPAQSPPPAETEPIAAYDFRVRTVGRLFDQDAVDDLGHSRA